MNLTLGFLLSVAIATWALVNIWSSSTETGSRLAWSLFVLIFPFVGTLVWYFAGPKRIQS